jgi:hypothetical protein
MKVSARVRLDGWAPIQRLTISALIGAAFVVSLSGCSRPSAKAQPRVPYVPIEQIEQTFGRLITVSNAPTPDQNGTGDRLGLFRDHTGTIWGLPITENTDRSVLACAPPSLHELPVTDTLPKDAEIVGASNEPTGWRGGTGKLELLLRDANGNLHWHPVAAAEITNGPVCWSQSEPIQSHRYYRLASAAQ